MSWARRLAETLLASTLLWAGQATWARDVEAERLRAISPEELLDAQPQRTPVKLARPWFALRLRGTALEVSEVTRTQVSRDQFAAVQTGSASTLTPPKQKFQHVLDLPPGALMAVGMVYDQSSDASLRALVGRHPNLLASPALLTAQWRLSLPPAPSAQASERWELFTDVQRRLDGQLLAGSMRLMARQGSQGAVMELIPPAHGMAFQRQELLWLGWLPGQTAPGVLLRRVLLTGEEEHLLIVNDQIAIARHDPDAPTVSFTSGVDEDAGYEQIPFGQKRPSEDIAGQATLQFDAQEWVRRMEAAEKTPLVPQRLMQQQTSLGNDVLKVFIDYLPRLTWTQGGDNATPEKSSASPNVWGGSLLVKVEFRGKTSVLMEAGFLEDPLSITLGLSSDGTPGLQMNYDPHYNNSFSRSWIWDDSAGRFRRWTNRQSQGC